MSKTKHAQDVVNSIRRLADSFAAFLEVGEETIPAEQQPVKAEAKPTKDVKKEPKQPTLEEVRAAMAAKNKEGHRETVKAILLKFGANKLTALDSNRYVEVLKEVGEIV